MSDDNQFPVDIHDRVTEAYYGKMGQEFMRETQARIHWICAQVNGRTVLDVGCSQGIVPILLARDGIKVVGVDTSPKALEEAKAYVLNEPKHVQEKISFVNADFLSYKFSNLEFDTVVMSEVLEHLIRPESFIDVANRLLSENGRIVVTVPFGINDFIDHKHTFYLLEPLKLISKKFEIVEIQVLGKWLGIVGKMHNIKETKVSSEITLSEKEIKQLESAFLEIERNLRDELFTTKKKLEDANLKYRSSAEQYSTIKSKLVQEEMNRKNAEQMIIQNDVKLKQEVMRSHEFDKKLVQRDSELEMARSRLDEANLKYRNSSEQITLLKEKLVQEEMNRKNAEHRLDEANLKYRNSSEQVTSLKEKLVQEETNRKHADQKLVQQDIELELNRSRLDEANLKYRNSSEQITSLKEKITQEETNRKNAEQTISQKSVQLQQEVERAHEFDKKLVQRDSDLAIARNRLDEANLKYRNSSEQITSLKGKLAQEEISRESAEQAIIQEVARTTELNNKLIQRDFELAKMIRCRLDDSNTKKEFKEKLEVANQKYRWATGEEIPKLKKSLAETSTKLQRMNQMKLAAEKQVIKTRSSLSFQLGYILIHSFKSFRGFAGLPLALWSLFNEALRRRRKKIKKEQSLASIVSPAPQLLKAEVSKELKSLSKQIESIKISNVTTDLKMACVMDEFTFESYRHECNLKQLSPGEWESELEAFAPEVLFIESAWRGKDDLWGSKISHTSKELQGIIEWCRSKGAPTIFWNKEDPVHFETFLTTAKLFDYIFTTDIDCIHRYKSALGHERVYLLPFACQPMNNNPIETYTRKDAFCFAGAYYVRYPERTRDLGHLIDELSIFKPVEIYDRNFGKNDPNYQFPEDYKPYIVGTLPFDQIDKAYKGYNYAINLNSIKQSQTMFARRVFELLVSKTITVSNFSRGVRLLFGDLVFATDSGAEMVGRLKSLEKNDVRVRKHRLMALRKVLEEHTYSHRLAYIVSRISGEPRDVKLPHVAVIGLATNQSELEKLISSCRSQKYTKATLYVVLAKNFIPVSVDQQANIKFVSLSQIQDSFSSIKYDCEFVAFFSASDYYGPNYLLDMAFATKYSKSKIIGKKSIYVLKDGIVQLENAESSYRTANKFAVRCSLINLEMFTEFDILHWLESVNSVEIEMENGLVIDEFNYCKNGANSDSRNTVIEMVDDLQDLDTGITLSELLERAERIPPAMHGEDDSPVLTGKQLSLDFKKNPSTFINLSVDNNAWVVVSTLEDGKHEYLYSTVDHNLSELGFSNQIKLYLDTTPGLNIQFVIVFLDVNKQKISHVIKHPNRNQEADIPLGTEFIRLGLRFHAGGRTEIKSLVLGHRKLQPPEVIGRASNLLLTNHYPSYEDLYRNAFVHGRVKAYKEHGVRCDVYRLRPDEGLSYHEFEGIDVTTGSQEALNQLLLTGKYKSILVHFLDQTMWDVLKNHIDRIKVVVWVHGAEIQPFHRREFNYNTEEERVVAKMKSDARSNFWKGLLSTMPKNLTLIFVSKCFAEEVMDDFKIRIPESQFSIIHNPINTELFKYYGKSDEHRKKILSIRSFASPKYANDLSVRTILLLSKKSWFKNMEFKIIGDGKLFEETVKPLRCFENVHLEQRFLNQTEISSLQNEFGIFLCPTRWDSHGVSRDEAMSAGLVPITNAISAIPEFVDENCGILAPGEDCEAMAMGIERLYHDPKLFKKLSASAAVRVRGQSELKKIIGEELKAIQ